MIPVYVQYGFLVQRGPYVFPDLRPLCGHWQHEATKGEHLGVSPGQTEWETDHRADVPPVLSRGLQVFDGLIKQTPSFTSPL